MRQTFINVKQYLQMIVILNDTIMLLASASGERKKQTNKKGSLKGCKQGCFALLKRTDAEFTVSDDFCKSLSVQEYNCVPHVVIEGIYALSHTYIH